MTTRTTKPTRRTEQDLLGICLNDHLAGATVGLELVQRMAASAEPGSESATVRKRLVSEIAADRSALIKIMTTLGLKIRGYKMFAAWAGEKAGRLKFNGHLLHLRLCRKRYGKPENFLAPTQVSEILGSEIRIVLTYPTRLAQQARRPQVPTSSRLPTWHAS